jgi:hypothetical protein
LHEHHSEQLSRVGLVVHDEDPDAVERRKSGGRQFFGRDPGDLNLLSGAVVRERESHGEGRPLPRAVALGLDGPFMELHEMAHDGEP